jgi:hypothetical protein
MVNICTDFNLSNTTFHIKNINKLLPFITSHHLRHPD